MSVAGSYVAFTIINAWSSGAMIVTSSVVSFTDVTAYNIPRAAILLAEPMEMHTEPGTMVVPGA